MKRENAWLVGGAGDLVFETETKITTTHHSGGGYGPRGHRHGGGGYTSQSVQIIKHGFMAIADVHEVDRLIRREIIDKVMKALDDD
jgi:hypothetical protein